MQPIAIILITISVFMHAGWNLVVKRWHSTAAVFLVAEVIGALCLSPLLIVYRAQIPLIPAQVWWLIGITGFFQAVYFSALAGSYRTGDMSIAYPFARSSSVIFVTIVSFLLGKGTQISWLCLGGIMLVVVGCFVLPMKQLGEFRLRNYLNPSCRLAFLTALAIAGYSMIDDEALRQLRGLPEACLTPLHSSLMYIPLEIVSCSFFLGLFVLSRGAGRANLRQVLRRGKREAAFIGIVVELAYILVLISMAFVTNISYVVAFRQLSILMGVLMGVFILREPRYLLKFLGVMMLFAGLVLVGIG